MGLFGRSFPAWLHLVIAVALTGPIPVSAAPSPAVETPASRGPSTAASPPSLQSTGVYVEVLATANVLGEVEPCGCSVRLGGIPRRADLITGRRQAAGVILVDSGDHLIRDRKIPVYEQKQSLQKARILADSLGSMGYDAVVPGETDLSMGLADYKDLMKKHGVTVVCANLLTGRTPAFAPHVIKTVRGVRVGLFGLLQPDRPFSSDGAKTLHVTDAIEAARIQVASLKPQVDLIVAITHQGLYNDRRLAERVPGIDVIAGSHSKELLNAGIPVGAALIVQAGSQGKWITRVGWRVARLPGGAVRLDDRTSTTLEIHPSRAEDPHWAKALETYREWVKVEGAKIQVPRPGDEPGDASGVPPPAYWGQELCGQCHVKQDAFWKTTRHSHAYDTLLKAKKHLDVECLACHTVGFSETRNKPGLRILSDVAGQENVQCESCHGPGSLHNDKSIRGRASLEATCRGCHDPKNSPSFDFARWLPQVSCPKGN